MRAGDQRWCWAHPTPIINALRSRLCGHVQGRGKLRNMHEGIVMVCGVWGVGLHRIVALGSEMVAFPPQRVLVGHLTTCSRPGTSPGRHPKYTHDLSRAVRGTLSKILKASSSFFCFISTRPCTCAPRWYSQLQPGAARRRTMVNIIVDPHVEVGCPCFLQTDVRLVFVYWLL